MSQNIGALTLRSFGGVGTVTGSRHLLELGKHRVLIDCGLFQGLKVLRERNWAPFPYDVARIDAIVLTHAHLDHSGYLPRLVREGYRGPIYCSSATADLCKILLMDSAHISENDAAYANRKGHTKHRPALPLYTTHDVERTLKHFRPVPFDAPQEILPGISVTLKRAGHILGAGIACIEWKGLRFVGSGDLGRYDDPFMLDPSTIDEADFVMIESTYGDRLHPKIDARDALLEVVSRTVRRGGTVIIPAFAVGRTQLLLYQLWMLKHEGKLANIPIFLDSPLAISATNFLRDHLDDHRFEADVCEQSCSVATYVRDVEDSKALTDNPMPKIIIAGSGMATGGRVLHHIKAYGPSAKNTILFSGYQAEGTRGAALLAGAPELKMFGQWIQIRAEVAELHGLSAHADADELMRWLSGFYKPPKRIFIVHGEPAASEALRVRIVRELQWPASVVDQDRLYDLAYSPHPVAVSPQFFRSGV